MEQDQLFPADLILLSTSNEDGTCFVSTSSLDGEKNLKKRQTTKGIERIIQSGCLETD